MVLCDCIFVFQESFVSVVCDWLMCAVTDLCVDYNVNCDNVSQVPLLYVLLCIVTEENTTKLVMCRVLIVIMLVRCCSIVYCDRNESDRVGDVYCVNCDNISEVL